MSSCDCESPSCFTSTDRRARKTHSCGECHRPIVAGEVYREVSGVWDGHPDRFRFHRECDDLRCALEKHIRENREREREESRVLERVGTITMAPSAVRDWNARRRAATRYEYLCDCISLGSLEEALIEFTEIVLGYDPKTGGPLRVRGAA